MSLPYEKKNVSLAKELRKRMTKWERRLWYNYLAACPVRFQRQKAIGPYIVDFYCHEAALVIELDGRYHLEKETSESDVLRQQYLTDMGLLVLRFSNSQIQSSFSEVCDAIRLAVEDRTSQ